MRSKRLIPFFKIDYSHELLPNVKSLCRLFVVLLWLYIVVMNTLGEIETCQVGEMSERAIVRWPSSWSHADRRRD